MPTSRALVGPNDRNDIFYDGAKVRLVPGDEGFVPVKDQNGRVIGRVVDAIPGANGMIAMVIDLDSPLETKGTMSFAYSVTR